MKLLVIFGFLFSAYSSLFGAEVLIDKIDAVVEGSPILHSQIIEKVQKGPLVSISDYPSNPGDGEMVRALNDAINLELILKTAEQENITVEDADVEKEIERFLRNQGTDKNGLKKFLGSQGRSYEEYKEDFATQLIVRRFQGRFILPKVKISEEDLRSYYNKRGADMDQNTKITLHHILFSVQSKSDIKKAQKKAASVYAEILKSNDFYSAVRKYSQDEYSRPKKGMMGDFEVKDLHPAIQRVIVNLKDKQVSPPTLSPMGMHLFYISNRTGGKKKSFDKLRPRLEAELRSLEMTKQTQLWLLQNRAKSKIVIQKS